MTRTRRAEADRLSRRVLLIGAFAGGVFGGVFAAIVSELTSSLHIPSVLGGAALHASLGAWLARWIDRAERSAITDPLTGLFNRRYFRTRLSDAIRRRARYGARGAILALDVDQMKAINDSLGHAAGDRALRLVAETIRQCVRSTDVPARVGGDEFAVLLLDHSLDQAASAAKRINASLRQKTKTWPVPLSVSVGVAAIDASPAQADDLLGAADLALYRAKRAGRDRVEVQAVDAMPRLTLEEVALRFGRAGALGGKLGERERALS